MVSIFTVDAFTETPFSGNPAGVCIVPRADDDSNNAWYSYRLRLDRTYALLSSPLC